MVPERIVIPVSPEVAIVKSSAFGCPTVSVPKSNLPLESMRSLNSLLVKILKLSLL